MIFVCLGNSKLTSNPATGWTTSAGTTATGRILLLLFLLPGIRTLCTTCSICSSYPGCSSTTLVRIPLLPEERTPLCSLLDSWLRTRGSSSKLRLLTKPVALLIMLLTKILGKEHETHDKAHPQTTGRPVSRPLKPPSGTSCHTSEPVLVSDPSTPTTWLGDHLLCWRPSRMPCWTQFLIMALP